ncbi:HAD-IA family hydrolase [Coralloluteibacterium stylophorae]|uniref:HAD-IA family hydrolase n=1 Tax=Coralloluteibacterium stylophorae TaxID=1776034 RepID=A0A8J7VXN6_9GAMM|nr:HAD-IA family hydrolase [Coralloluteibacterium stylophorae]MBS7456607.1 HAD-IA family hydrolase [Coralloluteibacterium stylophorae]
MHALIFDIDGTFADTERDGHRVAFNLAFREAGLDWRWDEVLYGELLRVAGGRERLLHWMRRILPDDLLDGAAREDVARQLHAAKTRHYVELVARGCVALRPGIARLVEEARTAGLRLAIATTTSRANVEALLAHTLGPQAVDWFAAIACGEDAPAKKPDPGVYACVLRALGLAAGQCLALEDSGPGLAAARAAGVPTVVTRNPYTHDHVFEGALAVVDALGDGAGAPCVGLDELRRWHAAARPDGAFLLH